MITNTFSWLVESLLVLGKNKRSIPILYKKHRFKNWAPFKLAILFIVPLQTYN